MKPWLHDRYRWCPSKSISCARTTQATTAEFEDGVLIERHVKP